MPTIEKLVIRYCDIKNKKIYISFSKNTQEIYWLPINIDSSFNYNLTQQNKEDIIYLGKFRLRPAESVQFSFMSIYSMNQSRGEYNNIYNDFYFAPDPSNLKIFKANYFIDSIFNALIVGFYEGSGNFFEYKIYGYKDSTIKTLYEPAAPIQNGFIYATNYQIYEFENLFTSLLYWEKDRVKSIPLRKTPLIDFEEGDVALEYKINDDYTLQAPSKVIVPLTAKLQIIQNGLDPSIQIIYDDQFFSQNLNELIPKKKGTTKIAFESEFGEIQKQISVVIK
jgi:hypothetical protein